MNVEASEAGSVGKTEVTGPPAVQESRWGPLPKWDAGHQGEGEIRTPQVQVGTSCIRGFWPSPGLALPGRPEVNAQAPRCLTLVTNSYQAGHFSAMSEASGGWLQL